MCVRVCVCVFGHSVLGVHSRCDQARPPAGDLEAGQCCVGKGDEGKERREKGSAECYLFLLLISVIVSGGLSVLSLCVCRMFWHVVGW